MKCSLASAARYNALSPVMVPGTPLMAPLVGHRLLAQNRQHGDHHNGSLKDESAERQEPDFVFCLLIH
jgi:hypothetical protein